MKMKILFVLFLYGSFLLAPTIVRIIEKKSDNTAFVSIAEEEVDTEKEIKAIVALAPLKINYIFIENNPDVFISKNLNKHEPISFSIFIPPPELL